jgi:hypothetical protein
MPDTPLLLDACVTINLLAAGSIEQIARDVGRCFLVTTHVRARLAISGTPQTARS